MDAGLPRIWDALYFRELAGCVFDHGPVSGADDARAKGGLGFDRLEGEGGIPGIGRARGKEPVSFRDERVADKQDAGLGCKE